MNDLVQDVEMIDLLESYSTLKWSMVCISLNFRQLFGRDFLKQMLGRACFMAMEISFRSIWN